MKPYNELTRLGRLRRLRQLAQAALDVYGLTGAVLTFLQYEGNLTYRVDLPGLFPQAGKDSPYVENRYLLRVLTTSDMAAVESELIWLAALSQDAGLPVPKPVPTLEGKLSPRLPRPEFPRGKLYR